MSSIWDVVVFHILLSHYPFLVSNWSSLPFWISFAFWWSFRMLRLLVRLCDMCLWGVLVLFDWYECCGNLWDRFKMYVSWWLFIPECMMFSGNWNFVGRGFIYPVVVIGYVGVLCRWLSGAGTMRRLVLSMDVSVTRCNLSVVVSLIMMWWFLAS